MKYDDFDLTFYKAVFDRMSKTDLSAFINANSNGKYHRKIGFLYEFLTDQTIALLSNVTGNYIDVLESKNYHVGKPGLLEKVKAWE